MKKFTRIGLYAFMLLSNFMLFAQGPGGDGDDTLEGTDPPPSPINSKLIILLIIGIIFVAYTYRNQRKKI